MTLQKVISGGQTGVDQAALLAARRVGIPTGGFLPLDCVTTDGRNRSLLYEYDMEESDGGYKKRTYQNVECSDATIRIASNFNSPGEVCTLKAIKKYSKPFYDVPVESLDIKSPLIRWLVDRDIEVLNVAGNSEKSSPGIFDLVVPFLVEVFHRVKTYK